MSHPSQRCMEGYGVVSRCDGALGSEYRLRWHRSVGDYYVDTGWWV